MQRNNGRAESRSRSVDAGTSELGRNQAMVLALHLLQRTLLCISVLTALCTTGVFAQSPSPTPQTVPSVVSVDVSRLDNQSLQYQFPRNELQKETKLEFRSNGNWSYVWFDELPKSVSLKNRGGGEAQKVGEENWYWFKNDWKFDLEIESNAQAPVVISYFYRSLSGADNDTVEKLSLEQKRAYVLQHENSYTKNPKLNLEFRWGPLAGATASPPSNPSPGTVATPLGTPFQPPESTWFVYLTDERPEVGLFVLLVLIVFIVISWLFASFILRFVREWKDGRPKRPKKVKKRGSSELDSLDMHDPMSSLPEDSASQAGYKPKVGTISRYVAGEESNPIAELERTPEQRPPVPERGAVFYPIKTEPTRPTLSQPDTNWFESERKKLVTLIETRTQELRDELNQKTTRQEQNQLRAAESMEWEKKLDRVRRDVTAELGTARKELEALVLDQATQMDEKRKEVSGQIARANEKGAKIEQQLENLLVAFAQMEQRLRDRLAGLQGEIGQPDSFYVKTVGLVLGQKVEALQDGKFEQLMGERLNQFFQTGVNRGEGLADLRDRADRINAAVKEVAAHIEKLNAKAYDEVRPHLQEVERLVTDLSAMQSQLQDRRTVLHIPVSLHAGARQTFLDGLGRGIKREIEKLDDPERYFESELERLVTAHLIAIVDICDKGVATPGTRTELEGSLNRLFEAADLSPILPSRGEPFKAVQHDLIETVPGGQSLTVSDVVIRGFYYKHRDKETLLRKAGVKVYR